MRKKVLMILMLAMAVMLAGCSEKPIDAEELASKLVNEGQFTEKLSEVSGNITEKRYALSDDEVEECISYSGTNAVVDEVVVFKAKDTDAVKNKVEEHVDIQETIYKDYAPDEVVKLKNCVIEVSGDYVILCISEDASLAEKIIKEYTK